MKKDLLKLATIGAILFLAGFLLKSIGVAKLSAEASAFGSAMERISFITSDGLNLHAWKTEADSVPRDGKPGLALLLPMLSETHESYFPLVRKLGLIGYTTIAFDMRGHGLSILAGDDTILYGSMSNDEFGRMPGDIESFFRDFRSKYPHDYDYNDVIIIGASIGANAAGLLMDHDWASRAVLLSPGRNYRELIPEKAMAQDNPEEGIPVYIATCADDSYSAESSQWLFDHYHGPKVFKKYPGQYHGTDILTNVKDADTELLEWLKTQRK